MRTRTLMAAAATSALALAGVSAVPESASAAASTIVTFNVNGGLLTITAPANSFIGSGTLGGTVTGSLGTVAVSDGRGELTNASWLADVSSTAFTTGAAGPNETVPNSDVSYWSGPAIATSGSGTFTPGQLTSASAVPLDIVQTAFTHTGGTGGNTASWNPTLIVTLPATIVTGTYTGTVTHSVA